MTSPAATAAAAPAAPEGGAAPAGTAAPVALYVHVPFCVSHCPYCDFVVVAGREARGPANRIATFVEAVMVELRLRAELLDAHFGPVGERPALHSLYIGGGTPSLLAPPALVSIIALVRERYGLTADGELTLEVNPGPDERGHAAAQREAGVTRMSIGAQSFHAGELRTLGRRHLPEDVAATVRAARAAGIGSVGLDLLYDVPGQTLESWARSLDAALALEPDHLSLYALTLDDPDAEGLTAPDGDHLPVRPGARRWRHRARAAQDEDRAAAMYELADRRLAAAGFEWYEISNWARPGLESRHNLAYWRRLPCEAVGPGAHAFDGVARRWNGARLDSYLGALLPASGGQPALPPGGREVLDQRAAEAERAMLALRTADGLGADATSAARLGALARAEAAGLVARRDDALVLTLRGRLLANEVFAELL